MAQPKSFSFPQLPNHLWPSAAVQFDPLKLSIKASITESINSLYKQYLHSSLSSKHALLKSDRQKCPLECSEPNLAFKLARDQKNDGIAA